MLGIHVRKYGTLGRSLSETFDTLKFLNAAQIFLLNPFSGANTTTDDDITNIREITNYKINKKHIIAHGSYVNNPWGSKNVGLIKHEFSLCYKAGISGLVVHLGNKTNETINEVLHKIMKFDEDHLKSVMLWLEINSVKSSENSFETPKKINKLFAKIAKITENSPLIVGLCIDTAHLWACGVSMTTYNNAKNWLDEIDPIPIMFHLNDSNEIFGSGKDIHQCITHGKIWGDIQLEKSGLAYISNYSKRNNCMVILERESVDDIKKEISILKKIGFI